MNKKKIALVIGSLGVGGAERVTLCLASFFQNQGYLPYIITAYKKDDEYNTPDTIERIILQKNKKKAILGLSRSLRKIIETKKIDIVIIMDTPTCLYAIPACIGTGVTTIVSERNDPAHFSGKNTTKIISRFLMRMADGYVFQTKGAKDYYRKMINNKGEIIPNPLNTLKMPVAKHERKEKVIVSVGRLDPQKNHKMLINAFSLIADKYPDYLLIIYGEGGQRSSLEAQIESLKLKERVLLPGTVENVAERIKGATLFVFSSDFEGMPNALIEAMAIGLPCISTNCPSGGPAALIKNKKNGILVEVGNEKQMSGAISYLLDNPQIAQKMGENAMLIRNNLSVKNIGAAWEKYILKIYNKKHEQKNK